MPGNAEEVRVRWVSTESASAQLAGEVEAAGGRVLEAPRPYVPSASELDDYPHDSMDPLMIVGLVLALADLVERISARIRQKKEGDARSGGLVIDVREDELRIKEGVQGVHNGTIVVISKEGATVYPPARSDDALRCVRASAGA